MKCIIGLGNPGLRYQETRHNIGIMVIEKLSQKLDIPVKGAKFHGLYGERVYKGEKIILLQPLTYMNNSGRSVAELMRFYKLELEDLLVIYDDLDLEIGQVRFREKGSSGGHNGMKSIIEFLGSNEFSRLRLGIGRPVYNQIDYVLSKFSASERKVIDLVLDHAVAGTLSFIDQGISRTMSQFNKTLQIETT